jgi:predicted nuclease of predicted toxin-antitoxin system
MKLLLDTCVWGGAKRDLIAVGHDVVWAGDWPEDPGDEQILSRAREEGRIVVTLDKDFGELAIVHGKAHAGIVRLVDQSGPRQAAVCLGVLSAYGADLEAGAIVTAEPGRLRFRPPDSERPTEE